jgi:pimeloyl-ACP methyl ester carboxylesterase
VARIAISGIGIDYELIGKAGAPTVVITPGGRFSRESIGVRELGEALVAGGRRVLLWDRPNCGASDLVFEGDSESEIQGRTLMQLVRELDLGPVTITGGSGGSRVSLIAASRDPDMVSHLVIWWISGGAVGLMQLAAYYCGDSAIAASRGGMAAVANLPGWADQIRRNPKNRDILLAQNPDRFIETMQRWAAAYSPSKVSPVPGMTPEHFARLTMPVRVYRSGKSDISHTRRTSEWVHEMIPHSELVEPPWEDGEWNMRSSAAAKTGTGHFTSWPLLAPAILEFTSR